MRVIVSSLFWPQSRDLGRAGSAFVSARLHTQMLAVNRQARALATVSLLLLQASCLPWLDNATPGWFEPPLPWLMRAGGAWGVAAACCLLYSGAPQWQRTGVDLLRVVGERRKHRGTRTHSRTHTHARMDMLAESFD